MIDLRHREKTLIPESKIRKEHAMIELYLDIRKCLGNKSLLTNVRPAYAYVNGEKTNDIEGYAYEVVLPEAAYEKIVVKIKSEKPLVEKVVGSPEVKFEGLEAKAYRTAMGGIGVSATASSIAFAKNNN